MHKHIRHTEHRVFHRQHWNNKIYMSFQGAWLFWGGALFAAFRLARMAVSRMCDCNSPKEKMRWTEYINGGADNIKWIFTYRTSDAFIEPGWHFILIESMDRFRCHLRISGLFPIERCQIKCIFFGWFDRFNVSVTLGRVRRGAQDYEEANRPRDRAQKTQINSTKMAKLSIGFYAISFLKYRIHVLEVSFLPFL